MAVKKNPDWHVWLGDILYWIRTPPGIYITIIAVLGAALWFSILGTPSRNTAWSPPPQPAPASKPQPQPVAPPTYCAPGTVYEARVAGCVGIVAGSQNHCPQDYIFIKAYNACTHLSVWRGRWYLEPTHLITLSGKRHTTITMNEGSAVLTEDFASTRHLLNAGDTITIFQGATLEAVTFTRIAVAFE